MCLPHICSFVLVCGRCLPPDIRTAGAALIVLALLAKAEPLSSHVQRISDGESNNDAFHDAEPVPALEQPP